MEGTTRGATADPTTGLTGRDADCNMASSTRSANEEKAHTARAGPPVARTPPGGEEDGPRGKGVLPGIGAEESYMANTTPGRTREEALGRPSPPAPPLPVVNSGTGGERVGAKWSPGRRSILRGPELWKLLKE